MTLVTIVTLIMTRGTNFQFTHIYGALGPILGLWGMLHLSCLLSGGERKGVHQGRIRQKEGNAQGWYR